MNPTLSDSSVLISFARFRHFPLVTSLKVTMSLLTPLEVVVLFGKKSALLTPLEVVMFQVLEIFSLLTPLEIVVLFGKKIALLTPLEVVMF